MPTLLPFRGLIADPSTAASLVEGLAAPGALEALVAAGALVRDATPMLYRYVGSCKLASGERERRGFIALLPVDAPVSIVAPPDSAQGAAALGAGVATSLPVVTYDDAEGRGAETFSRLENTAPRLDVTTADGVRHRLWSLDDPAAQAWVLAPIMERKVHLVCGRADLEAQRAYAKAARARSPHGRASSDATPVLAVAEQDAGLAIERPHHLVAPTVSSKAIEAAIAALGREPFDVREYFYVTGKEVERALHFGAGSVSFAVVAAPATRFFLLSLRRDTPVPGAQALKGDDAHVLEAILLGKLGIPADALSPVRDMRAALDAVREHRASATILMNPITLADAKKAVAAGQTLPGGPLGLRPAVPAALVAHRLDPDEPM